MQRGAARGAPPCRQRRPPQLGGQHAAHLALGARHELLDHVRHRASAVHRVRLGLGGTGGGLERTAEAVERLPLSGGHLGEQPLGVEGAEADRSATRPYRRATGDQSFEGGVGIGPRQPGRSRDLVAGGRAQPQQPPVHTGLRRSEAKRSKIDGFRSSKSYY